MIIIYGPYKRKDNRFHIILYNTETKKGKTISYAKYLMEQYLDRKLLPNETVDHIDEDPTNNNLSNLQVLTRVDNIKKSAKSPEMIEVKCPECGVEFNAYARRYRSNQLRRGSIGPFCSRSCAGKYNADVG